MTHTLPIQKSINVIEDLNFMPEAARRKPTGNTSKIQEVLQGTSTGDNFVTRTPKNRKRKQRDKLDSLN